MSPASSRRFRYRSPLDLPLCGPAEIPLAEEAGAYPRVYIEAPGQPRTLARPAPHFVDDPDAAGLFAALPPDRLLVPPRCIVSATKVQVTGHRAVLCPQGIFFTDAAVWGRHRAAYIEAMRGQPDFEQSALSPAPEGNGEFDWNPEGRPEHHLDGTVVLLSSAHPSDLGSFFLRILPKLAALPRYGLTKHRLLVKAGSDTAGLGTAGLDTAGHSAAGHNTFRQLLELAGVPAPQEQIIDYDPLAVYHLDHVVVPSAASSPFSSTPHELPLLDEKTQAFYARLREQHGVARAPGKRLYVPQMAGGQATAPLLHNEQELIEGLRARGFIILAPEALTAAQQIGAFSSAELVVGPAGAGMCNVVFCHPGTRLISIECAPEGLEARLALFASCNLAYGLFVAAARDLSQGAHPPPYTVNIEALLSRIDNFRNI